MLDASAGISPALAIRYEMIAHGEDGCRISGRGGAATRPAQVHILLAWLLPAVLPNGSAPDGTRRHEGPETAPSSWTMQHEIAPDVRGVTNAVRLIIRRSMVRVHPAPQVFSAGQR